MFTHRLLRVRHVLAAHARFARTQARPPPPPAPRPPSLPLFLHDVEPAQPARTPASLASHLPASTLERIAVIAGGDAERESAIIAATEQRVAREARDAALAEGWRRTALDAALASELARLKAFSAAPPAAELGPGSSSSSSSSKGDEGGGSTAPAPAASPAAAAAALLLRAAHAVLTSAGAAPSGAGREPQLLDACTSLGIDVGALQRLASARRRGRLPAASTQLDEEGEADGSEGSGDSEGTEYSDGAELSDSGSDSAWSSEEEGSGSGSGRSSGSGSDRATRAPRIARAPAQSPEDRLFAGISLPPLPASVGKSLRIGGTPIAQVPADAPGDLNPTSAEAPDTPTSFRRMAFTEVRARNELFIARRLLLQAISAQALEQGLLSAGAAGSSSSSSGSITGSSDTEDDVYVLPPSTSTAPTRASAPSLPATAALSLPSLDSPETALLRATHLMLSLQGSPLLARGALNVGYLARRSPGDPDALQPTKPWAQQPHTVRQMQGGAVNRLPWGGPGGIHALSGLHNSNAAASTAGSTSPPPLRISAKEANQLAVELGYPARDPATGLALVVTPQAALDTVLARKALRRVPFDERSRASALAAAHAAAAPDAKGMVERLLEGVEAEDLRLGVAPAATRPSLLPPGFRNWTEVVTTASAPSRRTALAASLSASQKAVLDSPLKPAKDGYAPPTPRATRLAANLTAVLSALLAEGAVGPLAIAHPALFPGGMPPEVAQVEVTPDFRAAYVRWTLPALARVNALRTPLAPAPAPPASLEGALRAGMHLTSPTARALLSGSGGAQARASARERARARAYTKPRAADAHAAAGAAGGGVTPRLAATPGLAPVRAQVQGAAEALERCAWDLRRALAARLGLRFVPRLHFFLWEGVRGEARGKGGKREEGGI